MSHHQPHSKEAKEKMRMASLGKVLSKETREKISKANKGRKKPLGFRVGHPVSLETREKISIARKRIGSPWNVGSKRSEESRRKMSLSQTGKKFSVETRRKISKGLTGKKHSAATRLKRSVSMRGKNSKGGVTSINEKVRKSIEYRLWREAVFIRDQYICRWCGQRGGDLNAHHIKPFALFPELRFAVDNGITLCVSCHRKTYTYGSQKGEASCQR